MLFSYAHLPLVAYAAVKHPTSPLWIIAVIPQIGMAMPFLLLVIGLSICGAGLIAPDDPFGYLAVTFPGDTGAALLGIPTCVLFLYFYVRILARILPASKLSRGWVAVVMLWSVVTNAFMIPVSVSLDAERSAHQASQMKAEQYLPADAPEDARP